MDTKKLKLPIDLKYQVKEVKERDYSQRWVFLDSLLFAILTNKHWSNRSQYF